MDEHVEIDAVITDRHGNRETVYAGSMAKWAWEADRAPEWRKMKRALLLGNRTSDPRGWRVTFHVREDEA